jgi:ABC-type uncharacterized transport system involved in gliding motility auxiliary subunit
MKRNLLSTTGLVIGLVLFAIVNLFAQTAIRAGRVDLTENGLFTLSDGTKRLLSKLDQKIRLRYYFSKETVAANPEIAPIIDYAKRVQELLEEYVVHGGGNVSLEVIDPAPFSEEEDDAVGYGLSNPPINQAGDRVLFGLVATNSVDDQRSIPFFNQGREEFLEYDVSELVSDLSHIEKPVVGILAGLPVNGQFTSPNQPPEPAWFSIEQLQQGFETRELPPETTKEIPADVKILVVIHPKGFSQELQYAIDQFVLKGGKLIAFVDPYCFFDQNAPPGSNPMMQQKDSNLNTLFAAWGVELVDRKLAGDRTSALPIEQTDLLTFLGLRNDCLSKSDVVTGDLSYVQVLMPGILKKKDGATTKFEPLLQTTEESQEVDAMAVQFMNIRDPKELLNNFVSGHQRLVVAARVSGPAKTAFPNGKPAAAPTPEGEDPAAADAAKDETKPDAGPQVTESEGIQVILVADADMLQDQLWVQKQQFFGQTIATPHADNGAFLKNAVENLTGDADLISLRSRGRSQRPFLRKQELARVADEAYRSKEEALEARLSETERQLSELQQKKSDAEMLILTPEQEEAIKQFEKDRLQVRTELRKVKHDLRKDIDALGTNLKFVNIGLVPLLITVLGLASLGSHNWLRRKAS